jgi:hypothetical protein
MKIVSFPHYTCGGLLCDILNNTFSSIGANGGIESIAHSLGKIGDTDTVLVDFDVSVLFKRLGENPTDKWLGTHCWLGKVDCNRFEKLVNVTVTSYRSKLYRWLRSYHLYFSKSVEFANLSKMECIDKQRETAKNYTIPFLPINHPNVVNLEFADVVDNKQSFKSLAGVDYQRHLDRWKTTNSFLYNENIWNNELSLRFYEAEVELVSGKYYVYE